MWNMLQSAQQSRLGLFLRAEQVRLYSAGSVAAPPGVFLEWHHTVTAVVASTHLPVITLTSDLSCSRTPQRYEQGEAECACMKKNTIYECVEVCAACGQSCLCSLFFSVSLCLFIFNTSGPNSEPACKSPCVCLQSVRLLDCVALAEIPQQKWLV